MLWKEGLEDEFVEFNINNQYVSLYFIDIEKGIEAIGEEIVDAKVPYARVSLTTDVAYAAVVNHMVSFHHTISFSPIQGYVRRARNTAGVWVKRVGYAVKAASEPVQLRHNF